MVKQPREYSSRRAGVGWVNHHRLPPGREHIGPWLARVSTISRSYYQTKRLRDRRDGNGRNLLVLRVLHSSLVGSVAPSSTLSGTTSHMSPLPVAAKGVARCHSRLTL